ncbi:hypothetical protein DAI22_08g015900 [Oryza sativa Japonica Group]|nr:hypothetical protein DAI22_08g015900 [Oryza sativa Japonica Group]
MGGTTLEAESINLRQFLTAYKHNSFPNFLKLIRDKAWCFFFLQFQTFSNLTVESWTIHSQSPRMPQALFA